MISQTIRLSVSLTTCLLKTCMHALAAMDTSQMTSNNTVSDRRISKLFICKYIYHLDFNLNCFTPLIRLTHSRIVQYVQYIFYIFFFK